MEINIKDMRHTAWRCRHSVVTERGGYMRCQEYDCQAEDRRCGICRGWRPSDTAVRYFRGDIVGTHKATLASIYNERIKKGTF